MITEPVPARPQDTPEPRRPRLPARPLSHQRTPEPGDCCSPYNVERPVSRSVAMAVVGWPRLGARELNVDPARPTSMDCDQIRDAVSAMIDGEEPDLPAVIVEAHLAG